MSPTVRDDSPAARLARAESVRERLRTRSAWSDCEVEDAVRTQLEPRTGIAANKCLAESPDGARCRSGPVATGMRGPNKQGGARRLQRRLGQRSLVLLSAAAKSRNADLGLSAGTLGLLTL